uniref:Uncharacterized protein n=1 Tax=Heterorhabditis bacteriophora TaxID=37862 RepID=A0A1I7WF58_HETBA
MHNYRSHTSSSGGSNGGHNSNSTGNNSTGGGNKVGNLSPYICITCIFHGYNIFLLSILAFIMILFS